MSRSTPAPASSGVESLYETWGGIKTLTTAKAAEMLGLSVRTLAKARKATLVTDLALSTIAALAEIPVLTSVYSPDAPHLPVPVLRLGELGPSEDRSRRHIGFHNGMLNSDLVAAAERWWHPSHCKSVVDAGGMLVVHGGFAVALLRVWGSYTTNDEGYASFHASLVARCREFAATDGAEIDPDRSAKAEVVWRLSGPDEPWGAITTPDMVSRFGAWTELAQRVVGTRVLGGEGGPITTLTGPR